MLVYYDKERVMCDCGAILKKGSLKMHENTKKHLKYLEKIKVFRKNYFKEYVKCTCGAVLRRDSMHNHRKTKGHRNKFNENMDDIELTLDFE